jgi:PAS domain S-box-containing protein
MDAIVAVDVSTRILLFNPAAERMFGLTANEAIGQPLNILIPDRFHQPHIHKFDHFSANTFDTTTMAPQLKIFGKRADGTEFPIESTFSKSMIGGKLQMTAVLRDVTEQRRTEFELREVNTELRKLSANLQSVREEERTRISCELHDELGQQLTGLKLSLSWLTNRLKEGRATTIESMDEIRHRLDTAITSVRRISSELRPPILDDLDFGAAVTWQSQEFAKRSNLQISLNLAAAAEVTNNELATALFRIAQESLTNVARHANATRVSMDFVRKENCLVLTITDNGSGFKTTPPKAGIGLLSMRERATAVGSQFIITNAPGVGTTIQVITPLPAIEPMESQI